MTELIDSTKPALVYAGVLIQDRGDMTGQTGFPGKVEWPVAPVG